MNRKQQKPTEAKGFLARLNIPRIMQKVEILLQKKGRWRKRGRGRGKGREGKAKDLIIGGKQDE